jgi:hypothetical protein
VTQMSDYGRIGSADPATRPPAQAPAGLGDTASVRCAFTPGPWAVDVHRCKISVVNLAGKHPGSRGGGGRLVAATPVAKGSTQYPQALANARLIAAAPDLFYAVHDLLGYLLPRPATAAGISATPTPDYSIGKARAALAKARGESA